jgi:hypothetical protein
MFDSRSFFHPGSSRASVLRLDGDPGGVCAICCEATGLALTSAPRERVGELFRKVGSDRQALCPDQPAVYLLEGRAADGRAIAREGKSLHPRQRLPDHWGDHAKDFCARVLVFTGPPITEKIAQVIECLVARQLRHVKRAEHCSDGPTMPTAAPYDWLAGYFAFLTLRSLAPALAIDYLEPRDASDVASFANSRAGFEARAVTAILEGQSDRGAPRPNGALRQMQWGDYATVAERRADGWLLCAGSEIKKVAAESTRVWHRTVRAELMQGRGAVEVLGFPDRLALRVDYPLPSLVAVTKFVRGTLAGEANWQQFAGADDSAEPVAFNPEMR